MQSYDVNKLSKCIAYLDENNLYCWAMSQYFPYGGFKWLNQNSSNGYISKVDLEYPC